MGLILDSSVVIASERSGETVERLIERVVGVTGDQQRRGDSVWRLAHRRNSVGSRLFCADRKPARLPKNSRSFRNATLSD